MSVHSEKAKELFHQGYNCSQSVLGAFTDVTGLDFETSMKLASSFGAGMGRLREVCGSVSGMFMVVGLKYGYTDPKDIKAKTEHYRMIQELARRFEAINGHIVCRELLGLSIPKADVPEPEARTAAYYKKRPCAELVGCAAEILDQYLAEREQNK